MSPVQYESCFDCVETVQHELTLERYGLRRCNGGSSYEGLGCNCVRSRNQRATAIVIWRISRVTTKGIRRTILGSNADSPIQVKNHFGNAARRDGDYVKISARESVQRDDAVQAQIDCRYFSVGVGIDESETGDLN